MEYTEFVKHFPETVSNELCDFVENEVLLHSRYIFTVRAAGVQFGYCTHCHQQFRSERTFKHKSSDQCPKCKSLCFVQAAGVGRKNMRDHAAVVWYEKSRINPQAITARVIYVVRDYRKEYKNMKTIFSTEGMYLFEPGTGGTYFSGYGKNFKEQKTVYSEFDKHYKGTSWIRAHSIQNIAQAVKDTPFQYSTWESYIRFQNARYITDMVEFFDMAAKYPCIEYLTKAGFGHLIKTKLHNYQTHGAIHWRGKTLTKVLRISKEDLREMTKRNLQEKFEPERLLYLQRYRKSGGTRDLEEVSMRYDLEKYITERDLRFIQGYTTMEETLNYLLKQLRKHNEGMITTIFRDYRDYLAECVVLGMDLTEARYLFPNNLHQAHQQTSAKVRLKHDKVTEVMIQIRLKKELDAYKAIMNGYIIRPAASQEEMFQEGKQLNTCVGSYADRYAKGETNIYFIREEGNPDQPLYTCEIQPESWEILQLRGIKNSEAPKMVFKLVEQFTSKMKQLFAKNNKTKKAVAV